MRLIYYVYRMLFCGLLLTGAAGARGQQGLLWGVAKPGQADTAYLLGTVHLFPREVVQLPPVVSEKMSRCRQLYVEIQPDWKMVLKMITGGGLTGEQGVMGNKDWTDADWARIRAWFVDSQHMDAARFERLKNYNSAIFTLSNLYMDLYGYEGSGIEAELQLLARSKNLKVRGLDRDWQQIQSWYAHYNRDALAYWQSGPIDSLLDAGYYELADLFIAYAIQDTASLALTEKNDAPWADGLTLVAWRNHQWMPQLTTLMQQPAFVAVGAAHLYGPHGVLELLRRQGFQLFPITAHFGGPRLERFIRRQSRQYQLADEDAHIFR